MSAHTPGPWVAKRRAHGYAIEDAHGNVFANVHSYDVEGNVALILAAPRLLAALEAYVAGDFVAQGSTLSAERHNARLAAARAAIAQARGAS